jgi:acyl carrier protein
MTEGVRYVRQMMSAIVGAHVVEAIADDTAFFERGIVDSLQLVEIIGYVEGDLDIEIAGEDLSPENFGSIAGMARFLTAKGVI